MKKRRVLLVQLPIPPLGPDPIRGNVPLAGAYLKLFADARGLGADYDIEVFPAPLANALGDTALADELARREPWMVGFTCYLWNVERTLWVARALKRLRPGVKVVIGGPEITTDNAWVLGSADYDFAAVGEGEQTFAALLLGLLGGEDVPPVRIDGLYVPPDAGERFRPELAPKFRTPMPELDRLGSPYLAGILSAADERMLLLETTRGCIFNCKFCYYPKSYDKQYYLSTDLVSASLRHAHEHGAEEVFLLDPTLNQRKDFAGFVRLLAQGNPGRRLKYFGELRAEGITPEIASLLAEAGFTEVEVGLQSVERDTMALMDRKNNLKAFEKGVRALMGAGISVTVDLIVGLPGDTEESVRRGFRYLRDGGLYSRAQVFNLAVLPGTAFRHEARELGLAYQPRPPYYVLKTPTLDRT
ncbi:MAG TPA: radical SAM protein, partial [Gemmata sp.]